MAGYCHWQVTDDSGSDVTWNKNDHDEVYGIGPEVVYFVQPWKLFISLRHIWEFEAKNRPEGHITTLTFTKILF